MNTQLVVYLPDRTVRTSSNRAGAELERWIRRRWPTATAYRLGGATGAPTALPQPGSGPAPTSGAPAAPEGAGGPYRYGVVCRGGSLRGPCGLVELTTEQYAKQLSRPDALWYCPRCGARADWDDDSLCTSGDPD